MKALTCDLCEATAEGETFEAWMNALLPHYMQAHGEIMKTSTKENQEKWMTENKVRFDNAHTS